MNRRDFMTHVHELAEQLGDRLFALVAKQSESVRASALRDAKDRLRAELGGDQVERPRRAKATAPKARKQQRCSKCDSTEHNARRCDKELEGEPDEETAAVAVEPPPHNQPCRSLCPPRGSGRRAPRRRPSGSRPTGVKSSPRCPN